MAVKKPNELDFRNWINSISFVDKDNKVLPTELKPDESEDFDDDREELEEA